MIRLDGVHLELIDKLQPFFGNSRPEVLRTIVIQWLKEQYGMPGLRDEKAIR
jgi:hypothetical protein